MRPGEWGEGEDRDWPRGRGAGRWGARCHLVGRARFLSVGGPGQSPSSQTSPPGPSCRIQQRPPNPLAGPLPLRKRMCHGPRPPPPRLPEPSPGFSPGSWAFLPGAFLSFSALPTSGLLNPKVTPTPEVVGRRSGPPPLECSSQKRKKKKNVCVISEINHRGWYP